MRRVGIAIGLLSSLLLVPALAYADDDDAPPPLPAPAPSASPQAVQVVTVDSVHLRNGTLYRGHVSEIVPGDHVTIKTESGETKRVAWAEVERVIVAPTPIPPMADAPADAPAPPMVGPKARVHVTSPRRVLLYRRPAGSASWVQACQSPCDMDLPTGDSYRITGNGVPQSKEFRLEVGPSGFVDLVVDPPNHGGMVLGGIVAGGGGMTFLVGSLMALVGASNAGLDCTHYYNTQGQYFSSQAECDKTKSDGPGVRDAGLVALGVGAAVTGLGLLVFFNSATTDVDQHGGHAHEQKDAFVRTPVFKTTASSAESATPVPPASFPLLLQGRF